MSHQSSHLDAGPQDTIRTSNEPKPQSAGHTSPNQLQDQQPRASTGYIRPCSLMHCSRHCRPGRSFFRHSLGHHRSSSLKLVLLSWYRIRLEIEGKLTSVDKMVDAVVQTSTVPLEFGSGVAFDVFCYCGVACLQGQRLNESSKGCQRGKRGKWELHFWRDVFKDEEIWSIEVGVRWCGMWCSGARWGDGSPSLYFLVIMKLIQRMTEHISPNCFRLIFCRTFGDSYVINFKYKGARWKGSILKEAHEELTPKWVSQHELFFSSMRRSFSRAYIVDAYKVLR